MVNQAFIIVIAYRPRRRRRRRRRKIPGIGRYPMGPTIKTLNYYKTILAFWITRKKSPSVVFLLLKALNKTKERFSSDPTDQDAQN